MNCCFVEFRLAMSEYTCTFNTRSHIHRITAINFSCALFCFLKVFVVGRNKNELVLDSGHNGLNSYSSCEEPKYIYMYNVVMDLCMVGNLATICALSAQ